MKKNAEQILKLYEQTKPKKETYNSVISEVYKYVLPSKGDFYRDNKASATGEYQDNRSDIYDSTAENSADEFVNNFQATLCPVGADWISLEAGAVVKEQGNEDEVNKQLGLLSDIANQFKNASNFDVSFNEFAYDMIAGTATMLVVEGSVKNPIICRAVPLQEYCIDEGVDGLPAYFYRVFKKKKEIIKHTWKELESWKLSEEEQQKDMEVLEFCYYDYDDNKWRYGVIDKEKKTIIVDREYRNSPFITLRANKPAGEIYGIGDGIKSLGNVKTLNKAVEYSLQNFAMSIGFFLAQSDIDTSRFNFSPLSINKIEDVEALKHMSLPSNFELTAYNLEQLRMDIKRSMKGNTLPNDGNIVKSATEISARVQELNKSWTNWAGRFIEEFQRRFIKREFEILNGFGLLGESGSMFDEQQIDDYWYKVKVNSPLSKALNAPKIKDIVDSMTILLQLDPSGQIANTVIKVVELASELMRLMGMPVEFIKTKEERDQEQQQQSMAIRAQQEQAMQDDVAMSNAKEQGKADANR